jgi:hypothetical protein
MKKLFLLSFIVLLIATCAFAQGKRGGNIKGKALEKIEQWEKVKLIEVLNLDENTSVRFFARKKEHTNRIKDILNQREQLANKMEAEFKNGTKVSNNVYNDQINEMVDTEYKIQKERESFIRSLNDILSPEQIAKLTVFEIMFRREIRDRMMHGKNN